MSKKGWLLVCLFVRRGIIPLLADPDDDEVLQEEVDSPAPEHPVRHVQKQKDVDAIHCCTVQN